MSKMHFRILKKPLILWFGLFAIASAGSGSLFAQDRGNSGWYARIVPYLWFSNLGGASTLASDLGLNYTGDFALAVEDSVLETSWAAQLEIGKGRIRGMINIANANMKNPARAKLISDTTVTTPVHYDFTWFNSEFFAAAQIGPMRKNLAFELYGGGRYVHQNQNVVSDSLQKQADLSESWVDPVVGFRFFIKPGDRFWTMFHTDLGGFGVGSRFTWSMGGELGFEVVSFMDITMRYDYQEAEFDNNTEGSQRYAWDNGVRQGWFFGLAFKL